MSPVTHLIDHGTHLRVALACVAASALSLFLLPDPLVLFAFAALPFGLVGGYYLKDFPFQLCLAFVIFSFFRIHEVFPVLIPFRIPQLLAITTLLALCWHYFGTRLIRPYWSIELILFLWFFALCTVGIVFATDRPTSFKYWNEIYVKIAVMVLATAWLTREPKHFNAISKYMTLAGVAVAAVTLYNKANGIGLVEETRVTIGREFGSSLGDPNDLSLVLLFPMSFACSLLLTRGLPKWQRLLGLVSMPMILSAIIATQSRGGLLGAAVVIGVFARYKIRSNVVLVTIAGLGIAILFAMAGIADRKSGGAGEQGIDASSDGRLYAWGAAFRMALAHPLTGVGLDNFVLNYWDYSNLRDGHNHAVHSSWFGVLAETGFIGLGIFATMIGLALRNAVLTSWLLTKSQAPAPAKALGQALVAGLTASAVAGSFLTQAFTWPFYIQIALIVALSRYAESEEWREKPGVALAGSAFEQASENAAHQRAPDLPAYR
ncbi:MAG: O-antigen ligase family protein [Beijerinckiaceae bacterium]|nr:O-antigen ligase family protein [Beijerinckiaceae bacterium]